MIQFEGVTKTFRQVAPGYGLKDRLLGRTPSVPRAPQGSLSSPMVNDGVLTALDDLTFEIGRGEALAVIGRNGSGKSTCLALAAGVIKPTSGNVSIRGRVSPLLALGAGVHPDLTGRENVELNGVLLGLTRREIRQRFESIHAFSELDEFINQPVRHYSSGMLARLAFSVATHLDPEILIVDEVLAVGDAAFAQKCYDRIKSFRRDGLTMLYVSHDVHSVIDLCDRAVYLDRGRALAEGDPREVGQQYYADQGMTLG
ncbi:MAG: ABC transporter ATP-binding protein [Planctomycetota bacterium]